MEHTRYVCPVDHTHGCAYCQGGLFFCTICKGAEGNLPRDCPGVEMTEEQSIGVYTGLLDYREGLGWIVLSKTKDRFLVPEA